MSGLCIPKGSAVCFTGHRHVPHERTDYVLRNIDASVKLCLDRGYEYFITGGAMGFDTMAACRVIAARKRYGKIKLVVAVPFRGQADRWAMEDLKLYRTILALADEVVYVHDFYTERCYFDRNDWMTERSAVCLAYMTKNSGGTAYTVKRARALGLIVCNLSDVPFRGIDFDGKL